MKNHYLSIWGSNCRECVWDQGPVNELDPAFRVLEFPPMPNRTHWVYATCFMSDPTDSKAIELHLLSATQNKSLVELLTVVAHFHKTGAPLSLGHTVNFGRPFLDESTLTHGLISLPYLNGPTLEHADNASVLSQFLWLIPISKAERDFKTAHGLDALEECFEKANFNYLDPKRPSVV